MYPRVLGISFTAGGVQLTVLGAEVLPLTGLFGFAYWVVAAFTLLAAGMALLRLLPRRES